MKMSCLVLAGSFMAVACLVGPAGARDDKTEADTPDADKQKAYLIYTDSPSPTSGGGVVVTSLSREEFQGIPCLVGKGAPGWCWVSGKTIRVPVNKITVIIEFATVNEWKEAVRQYETGQRT